MAKFDFTNDTITCAGRTFPVKFSVTPSGSVMVFVTMPDRSEPARVRFTPGDEAYPAALAAAKGELSGEFTQPEEPATVEPAPVAIEESAPVEAAPVEEPAEERPEIISNPVEAETPTAEPVPVLEEQEPAAPVETETPTAEPVPAAVPVEQATPRTIPEKTFIGETITGKGWRILFDGEAQRTRVCFDAAPTDAARAAVEKAGFYFSAALNSYNKKLTFKAHRAAVALSGDLAALYA